MSIEKLTNGRYRVRIFQKGKHVANSCFAHRRDAELWEAEHKRRALRGELLLPQDTVTLKEALVEFAKKLSKCTFHHRREILGIVARIVDKYKLVTVADLQKAHVEAYIQESTLSSYSLARYVTHLKAFGRFLAESGYLRENPLGSVKRPKVRCLTEKRRLSDDELSRIFSAMQEYSPKIYDFCRFLALSGCRKMEAVTLEWKDVDFDHRQIFIHDKPHLEFQCKWGSSRKIPISSEMESLLRDLPRKSSFVFVNTSGTPLRHNLIRDLRRALMYAGVERPSEVNLHSFRHTWISRALENGIDLRSVMAYAGHRNISTTERYLHGSNDKEKMKIDAERFVSLHYQSTTNSQKVKIVG